MSTRSVLHWCIIMSASIKDNDHSIYFALLTPVPMLLWSSTLSDSRQRPEALPRSTIPKHKHKTAVLRQLLYLNFCPVLCQTSSIILAVRMVRLSAVSWHDSLRAQEEWKVIKFCVSVSLYASPCPCIIVFQTGLVQTIHGEWRWNSLSDPAS